MSPPSSVRTMLRRCIVFNGNRQMAKYIALISALSLSFMAVFLLLPDVTSLYPGAEGRLLSAHTSAKRKDAVSKAFQHAWDGYERFCFGRDALHPVSNTCDDDFGGWGTSAIDALSTAIIMEKENVVLRILGFIAGLDFDHVVGGDQITVFEVIIRHLGGMISAWDLLNGPFSHVANDDNLRKSLYDKMVDLGNRSSCAFNSPSGIPHDYLDPARCKTDLGARTALTTPGTVILEFSRLSSITGDDKYLKLAERAEAHLLDPQPASNQPFPGLLGSHININDGKLLDSVGSWGAYADSFYEYLLKAYIYNSNNNTQHLERWRIAAESTIKHVGRHPYGHPDWTLLPQWSGPVVADRMKTLAWFAGGNFILGGMVLANQTLIDFGLSIADAAGGLYAMSASGLGGEFISWALCDDKHPLTESCDAEKSMWATDMRYQLRPEVLETWYHAYRATSDRKYLDWSWNAFQSIMKVCKTESGFSGIGNVNLSDGGSKLDKQESFVLSEVFKYLYLLYLEDDSALYQVQDSRTGRKNTWVFNTEAHPVLAVGDPV